MSRLYDIMEFPLFAGADKDILINFLLNAPHKISSFRKGDIVVMQDSPCRSLMLLCQGSLSARMTNSEGKEVTIEILHAPEILAPAFLYASENKFPVTLQAEEDIKIWSLSKDEFLRMMETDTRVLRNFLRNISDRSLFLSRKLNEFALQSLSTRIIGYLKRNEVINNVQDVAFIMGVARPSLSRTLSSMVDQGLLQKTSDGYVLP